MDEITESRNQFVVKSNNLIQRSRYSMTLQQQRILLYLISKIKPDDTPDEVYTFDIGDFIKVCGITASTGDYYKTVRDDLLHIRNSGFWIKNEDGRYVTVAWLSKASICPLQSGEEITVEFDRDMKPYLFQLQRYYTQYRLKNILAFQGRYSIRLYELLRSHYTQKDIDFFREKQIDYTAEEIREALLLKPLYPAWTDFEKRVIRPAVSEITMYCDEFSVEYETIKKNHRVAIISFVLKPPHHRLRIAKRRDDKINHIPNHSPVG